MTARRSAAPYPRVRAPAAREQYAPAGARCIRGDEQWSRSSWQHDEHRVGGSNAPCAVRALEDEATRNVAMRAGLELKGHGVACQGQRPLRDGRSDLPSLDAPVGGRRVWLPPAVYSLAGDAECRRDCRINDPTALDSVREQRGEQRRGPSTYHSELTRVIDAPRRRRPLLR